MFCPRCGRAINENANFCGGCGLSRVEIEKFAQAAKVNNEAAQQTAAANAEQTPEVKSEVPFGTVVNEPVQPAAEPVAAEKSDAEELKEIIADNIDPVTAPAEEKTEPAEEAPKAEPAAESYSYTAPQGAEYHYTAQTNPANSTGSTQYSYAQQSASAQYSYAQQPAPAPKNENLSTVDFIWVLLISSIPVVGLIYLIYLAIQDNNTNKRSYARASLIISVFAIIVSFVFLLGFIIAGL